MFLTHDRSLPPQSTSKSRMPQHLGAQSDNMTAPCFAGTKYSLQRSLPALLRLRCESPPSSCGVVDFLLSIVHRSFDRTVDLLWDTNNKGVRLLAHQRQQSSNII